MIRIPHDRFRHHRGTFRLRGYDYTRAAAYFVTIRAAGTVDLLGLASSGAVNLNDLGRIVETCWRAIPKHFPGVRLDAWVVMPDHVHGIVILPHGVPERRPVKDGTAVDGAQYIAPLHEKRSEKRPGAGNTALVTPGSLGCVIRTFKAAVTREVNRRTGQPVGSIWQRNYHERIIRNDGELAAFRQYVKDNPTRWGMDNNDEPE